MNPLRPGHIQDHNAANTTLQPYWGYPSRVVPCTNDERTCEYLAAVYGMHETSMTYMFVLWGVLLGIAVVFVTIRGWKMGGPSMNVGSWFDGVCDAAERLRRRWLLVDAPMRRVFARVSRLQVVVLGILVVYLLIFSLVGIVYKTWMTPIEDSHLFDTRTGIGGWADRLGALAYALTPFTVLLSNRESVLSLVTGIPYQHFNFLHRWTGRIIFVQSFLHTLGWTVVLGRLYQPQPERFAAFLSEFYGIFGVIAMFLLTSMLVLSSKTAIKWFGYEFFRITHWVIAILYIGAGWAHWDRLWCWMVASLALIVIDQSVRTLRTCVIHIGLSKGQGIGFRCAQADVKIFGEGEDLVVRLDFDYEHRTPWEPGQHFQLCFPSLSIWQSHPFTPSSMSNQGIRTQHHTYIIRVREGQTVQLAQMVNGSTMPVILTGPYGSACPPYDARNLLAIAGGTGVTFTLPVVMAASKQMVTPPAVVDFIWIVRRAKDVEWLAFELEHLKDLLTSTPRLRISFFVTREGRDVPALLHEKQEQSPVTTKDGSSSSSTSDVPDTRAILAETNNYKVSYLGDHHPSISDIVNDFMERSEVLGGNIEVLGGGPESMGSDLRNAVAKMKTREYVGFYWDSRG